MAADQLAADMKQADADAAKAEHAPPVPQQAARSPETTGTRTPTGG